MSVSMSSQSAHPTQASAKRFIVPVIVIAATIFFMVLPAFRPPPFFESLLYLLFFWIALATSWTILSGFTGYFSFGHGAFYGVGMYTTANLAGTLSIWWCLPIAALLAALLGVAIGAVVFRVRRLRGELFALLTLALTIVLATIVLNTPIDGGPGKYLLGVKLPVIYENSATTIYLMGAGVAMGSLAIARWVQYSRLGRGLFAISDDEDVAEVLGVPTYRYKLLAFAISSGIAGVAGAVQAVFVSYVTVSETFSGTIALYVILMSVIGGARHWLGPAIGATFVTFLNFTFVSGDSALAARIVIGLALILATLFLPEGVVGLFRKRRLARQKSTLAPVLEAACAPPPAPIAQRRTDAAAQSKPERRVILHGEGISLAFRGVQALDKVDFEIREGEILGLVGPNGSGKSTLINVMSGFYQPDAGRLLLNGEDIAKASAHHIAQLGLARTFQIPRPFPRLTVLENVMVAAMFGGAVDAAGGEPRQGARHAGLRRSRRAGTGAALATQPASAQISRTGPRACFRCPHRHAR
jgi:branched-chain amino acid transport system permease protein